LPGKQRGDKKQGCVLVVTERYPDESFNVFGSVFSRERSRNKVHHEIAQGQCPQTTKEARSSSQKKRENRPFLSQQEEVIHEPEAQARNGIFPRLRFGLRIRGPFLSNSSSSVSEC
jgi:hypothetical protein